MSEHESQFILAGYRPDGSDADEPEMAAALDVARKNPELMARFDAQLDFDREMAKALSEVPVPADLKENILAGARVPSQEAKIVRFSWKRYAALPIAAAIVIGAVVSVTTNGQADQPPWVSESYAALNSLRTGESTFELTAPEPDAAMVWLASRAGDGIALPSGLAELPPMGCTYVSMPDGAVSLLCFDAGNGDAVHLAVYRGPGDMDPAEIAEVPAVAGECTTSDCGNWVSTSWQDGERRFLLMAANLPGARERLEELARPHAAV